MRPGYVGGEGKRGVNFSVNDFEASPKVAVASYERLKTCLVILQFFNDLSVFLTLSKA